MTGWTNNWFYTCILSNKGFADIFSALRNPSCSFCTNCPCKTSFIFFRLYGTFNSYQGKDLNDISINLKCCFTYPLDYFSISIPTLHFFYASLDCSFFLFFEGFKMSVRPKLRLFLAIIWLARFQLMSTGRFRKTCCSIMRNKGFAEYITLI